MWKYFKPEEFVCRHCGKAGIDDNFVTLLDQARHLACVPFVITSGYRCEIHDKALGGKGNHTTGKAVDILCTDSSTRYAILEALFRVGFQRIEVAPRHIHVDQAPDKPPYVCWLA